MADGRRRACDMASDNGRNGRNGSQRPGAGSGENGGNGKDASHEPNVGADGNGGNGGGESGAAESEGPAELLGEVRAIRRKARLARHAYWFPLVLFGLVAAARGLPYYWLGALLTGLTATVLWYRWRGNRIGLRTPARGYLITGLIVVVLAVVIPLIADQVARVGPVFVLPFVVPGDLVIRGTFPLVLIGL